MQTLSRTSRLRPAAAPLALALALGLAACTAGDSGGAAPEPGAPGGTEAATEPTADVALVAPAEPAPEAGTPTRAPDPGMDAVTAPDAEAGAPVLPTAMTDAPASPDPDSAAAAPASSDLDAPTTEVVTLGAGCFWCIEAVLEQIDGVESVVSGYMGGHVENPTYKEVCSETTGHAEVVQVTFDPTVISYSELLDWFWRLHDPTTLNRQGNDRGTQYRSAIFYHSDEQRRISETSKRDVQPSFDDPIVTEVTEASTFYPAEDYHQGFYMDNRRHGYCSNVIAPKLKKLGLKY
ncbi:MAG: peptide-methionine (S)-S-oxide reductase MsrA [Planctomycetota bacterium]